MQCHPFKGMTITLVPLPLIPPLDPSHQRSTRLCLNVLHLLARAAGSFHVCEEPDEYAYICMFEEELMPLSPSVFNSSAVYDL